MIDWAGTNPPGVIAYADIGDGASADAGDPAREGMSRLPEPRAEANPFVYGP